MTGREAELRLPPEALLREVQRLRRGRHKIYIGAAPGVGKTYTMLQEAHDLHRLGVDVVAGILEPHGRPQTAALMEGLESLPRRQVAYKGIQLEELDVAAALSRSPDLLLVDELAHSNAPGSPHAKRYEDVDQILDAGINVYSTLNIQHLESLNDVVEEITGVQVQETLPDAVLEEADEIRLIDLPPSELIDRLKDGKVYHGEMVGSALQNFFRLGNLTALRELSLRVVADNTDTRLLGYRQRQNITVPWRTKERVMVCVSPNPNGRNLIRRGYRAARRRQGEFHVVSVVTRPPTPEEAESLDRNLAVARRLGATVHEMEEKSVSAAIIRFAREHQITQIVLGESFRTPWQQFVRGSLIQKVLEGTEKTDVLVVAMPRK
ncbi:MAG: universal stress protein [Thermaerobacter sp.]|nr:universal stress protein [Thermaerobacter sp.]